MIITKRLLFLDTETTGKDPMTARIVELGMIFLNMDGSKEEKRSLINPGVPIPPEATEIHGITNEMVMNAPSFRSIAKALYKNISDCDLGGYNIDRYDIPVLSEEFNRCGIIFPLPESRVLDVYTMEKMHNSHKLGAVYERYFGKPLEGAHGALTDTQATLEIFVEMLDRHYKSDTTVEQLDEILNGDNTRIDRAGKLKKNAAGELVWNFGPHYENPVLSDVGFFNWVLAKDFSAETKRILMQYQKDKFDEQQNAGPGDSPQSQ